MLKFTKTAAAAAAAMLSLPALGACGGQVSAHAAVPSAYPSPASAVTDQLRTILSNDVKAMGDASPTSMDLYATNLGVVLQLEGGSKRSDDPGTPVFVLVAHGSFTGTGPRPPGTAAPHGTVLVVTLDAATLQQVELGLGPADPDFSNAGPRYAL